MCRLIGYLSNDPFLLRCCFNELKDILRPPPKLPSQGFGIGYYRNGDILLQKRPTGGGSEINYFEAIKEIKTNCLITHCRKATEGAPKPENTHPFKFHQWLFAHTGTINNFSQIKEAMLKEIPDFLARNIVGETDTEVLFHLFLTLLYSEGKLEHLSIEPSVFESMLRATIWSLDSIEKKAGFENLSELNFIVTNGEIMGALHRGCPLSYLLKTGFTSCEVCNMKLENTKTTNPIDSAHKKFKAVVIASELQQWDKEWTEVPEASMLIINKNLNVEIKPLY